MQLSKTDVPLHRSKGIHSAPVEPPQVRKQARVDGCSVWCVPAPFLFGASLIKIKTMSSVLDDHLHDQSPLSRPRWRYYTYFLFVVSVGLWAGVLAEWFLWTPFLPLLSSEIGITWCLLLLLACLICPIFALPIPWYLAAPSGLVAAVVAAFSIHSILTIFHWDNLLLSGLAYIGRYGVFQICIFLPIVGWEGLYIRLSKHKKKSQG